MQDNDEVMEPRTFGSPTLIGWDALRECLRDKELREGKFLECLVNRMRKRQRVDIPRVSQAVARELGGQYGKWASDIMRKGAAMTSIEVIG